MLQEGCIFFFFFQNSDNDLQFSLLVKVPLQLCVTGMCCTFFTRTVFKCSVLNVFEDLAWNIYKPNTKVDF